MAIKNQALTVCYVAWDTSANAGKTGDVANHTLKVITDGAAATPSNSPAEIDATNAPGVYKIALTADEMNGDAVTLAGKSSIASIVIIPVQVATERGRVDQALSTTESNIRGADSDTLKALSDQMDANYNAALAIANIAIWLQEVAEGDVSIDVSSTPWELVIKDKNAGLERVRKKLYQADGTPVNSTAHLVAQQLEMGL